MPHKSDHDQIIKKRTSCINLRKIVNEMCQSPINRYIDYVMNFVYKDEIERL